MHTVHLASEGAQSESDRRRLEDSESAEETKIWASALGIIFDRENYDPSITAEEKAIIDKFFDQLNFEKSPPAVNSENADYKKDQDLDGDENIIIKDKVDINFADLMGLVDLSSRWAYVGSLTTPPCTVGVYFQIVDRVLPISDRHYDAYVAHQKQVMQKDFFNPLGEVVQAEDASNAFGKLWKKASLDVTGNWRITNLIDNHNVRYMKAKKEAETNPQVTATSIALLVSLTALILTAVYFAARLYVVDKELRELESKGGKAMEVNGV